MAHPIKPITAAVEPIIERLRAICLALPGAEEKLAWGEPTFRAGKMFAQFDNNHHNAGHIAVWVNAPPGAQDVLVNAKPARFFIPPYQGKAGWIGILLDDNDVDWDEVAAVVEDGYRMVASRALVAEMETRAAK
jgi:hypothetical protein